MPNWKALLLAVAMIPGAALCQTERQAHVQSDWYDPEEARPRGVDLLRRVMVRAHDEAREDVDVPPLVWSDALAAQALTYARELARTRRFQHSDKTFRPTPQGENLWMGTRGAFTYAEMAATWVNERRYYRHRPVPDISTTGNWADVGHYTQMVWRDTTTFGCALASNDRDDYLVCRYTPPGNVYGRTIFGETK